MATLTDDRKRALRLEMEALLGPGAVLSDPDELLVYESDGLTLFRALADFVVFPSTAEHVSALVKLAHRESIPFVARGAGTGLSGGCLPAEGGLVISLMRMNRVLEVDYENQVAVVEPGLVNLHLSWAVGPARLLLRARSVEPAGLHHRRQHRQQLRAARTRSSTASPPTTSSVWRSCCPTASCSGSAARRAMRRATTWSASSSAPRAPSASPPRSPCGSSEKPQAVKTVLAVFDDVDEASEAVSAIIGRGLVPAAMEMIDQLTIQAVEDAFGCGYPRDAAAALLIELDGLAAGMDEQAERVIAGVPRVRRARGARGAGRGRAPAPVEGAQVGLRRVRPRVARLHGDGRRDPAHQAALRAPARERDRRRAHGLRVGNVFHAGDGNLHPNILYDPRKPGEEERVVAAGGEILKVCAEVGGSISGEHGIGLEKMDYMPLIFSEADLACMQRLKDAFNPTGLCNPGKIFPTRKSCGEVGHRLPPASDRRKGPRPALLIAEGGCAPFRCLPQERVAPAEPALGMREFGSLRL